MWEDPIVEQIRKARQAHAARFDNDLHRISEDLRRLEEAERAKGRIFVTRTPKTPEPSYPSR